MYFLLPIWKKLNSASCSSNNRINDQILTAEIDNSNQILRSYIYTTMAWKYNFLSFNSVRGY